MSFILDALRKSENERRRNESPGLADARVQPRSNTRSYWLPLVALLVGINISLLIVMWMSGDDETASTPTPQINSAPVYAPNAPRDLQAELAEPPPQAAEPPPVPAQQPTVVTPPSAEPLPDLSAEPATETFADPMPSLTQLVLDGAISVSPMRLDMHVYSDAPSERFVFINMSKYREGERTSEGPIIDEIIEDGVIMIHQGRTFLLTRE